MATITRYKRGPVSAQVQTEKYGAAPAQAEAQGQAGIAQAQKGLGAVHGQRASQEISSLSQKLNQFSQSMDAIMQTDAKNRGYKNGMKDQAQRRQEVFKLQEKYAGQPEVLAQKIAELETATMQDSFSTYGQVYQDAVGRSYASQAEVDASNAAKHAKNMSGGDPERFKESYNKYAEKYIQGAPTDLSTLAAERAFEKHSVSTYENMYSAQWSAYQANEQANTVANIKGLQGLISDAASVGDSTKVAAYQGQLAALVNSQVQSNKMGVDEAKWTVTESYRAAQSAEFARYGMGEAANGQGWKFIQRLQDSTTKEGKAFAALPVKSQEEIISKVERATTGFQDSTIAKEEFDNKAVRTYQETNARGYKEVIGKTGNTLTVSELKELEGNGTLSAKDVKDIIDYQTTRTDPEALTKFKDGGLLVNMSVDDIMTLPDVSPKDKQGLLKQREGALKDPNYDWLKSREGKRALDYMAEDFDVPKDGVAMIMSSINQEKTPNQAAYDKMKRELVRRVETFPYADQPKKAMEIYNELKGKREVVKEQIAVDKKDKNIANRAAEYKDRAQKTEDATFSFSKTPLELLDEDFANKKNGMVQSNYDAIKAKLEGTSKPKKQHRVPTKPKQPLTIYTPPKVQYEARAEEFGYTPKITGKNVDLIRVRSNIKNAAYPILKKYGAGIKDGFRYTAGGGAKRSQHLSGNALDVTWAGKSKAEKQAMIMDFKRAGFSGFGVGVNTLHIDMRKAPASWSYIGGNATGGGKMPAWARQAIEG